METTRRKISAGVGGGGGEWKSGVGVGCETLYTLEMFGDKLCFCTSWRIPRNVDQKSIKQL